MGDASVHLVMRILKYRCQYSVRYHGAVSCVDQLLALSVLPVFCFIRFNPISFPFLQFFTVQGVPLIQSVPRGERVAMISQAQIREFREGEYIIKQGEVGEELFIILEGACDVVEDKNLVVKSSSKDDKDKLSMKDKEKEKDKDGKEIEKVPNIVKLVTLREGHFFGEMSLMTVSTTYAT